MDQQVLKAQKWVNATYRNVSGYAECSEDGYTGWRTMYALTRALQVELGITQLSDTFGPTTLQRLTALGAISATTPNANIRTIVEAALYCKGYSGGNIDGSWSVATRTGLAAMLLDMGVFTVPRDSHTEPTVQPKVFKSLLTMDAYVLVGNGQQEVRAVQMWMNATFLHRKDFTLSPCDGHFSRQVQKSLMLAIQYSLGMADGVANGTFGPGTRDGLRSKALLGVGSTDPVGGSTHFVRLFHAAMIFNRRSVPWTGEYTEQTAAAVSRFQEFAALPITGTATFDTWASLLVSTGNPERKGKALDCRTPLNQARVEAVKAAGYETVGRYLTGGTTKTLTHAEVFTIINAGLSVFPIYQVFHNSREHFSRALGRQAAVEALSAVHKFGIAGDGTVVYFAVDFDAQDDDITNYVIPYFRGIQDGMPIGVNYAIGVYGSRNVCIRVSAAGLASRSFVLGMSTGYSGNLGYPLPDNWAFDQISTVTLAEGQEGEIEIDNDIRSGRDMGISSTSRVHNPNDFIHAYLVWLEARALQWHEKGHTDLRQQDLVAQYLRARGDYDSIQFDQVSGKIDHDFLAFVDGYPARPDLLPLRDPDTLADQDLAHFGASFNAVLKHGVPGDLKKVNVGDYGGWAGDVITVLAEVVTSGRPDSEAYDVARGLIAARDGRSSFGIGDFLADVDAALFGMKVLDAPSTTLSSLVEQYYFTADDARTRYRDLFRLRFDSSEETLKEAAHAVFFQDVDALFSAGREALFLAKAGSPFILVPHGVLSDVAMAFHREFLSWVSA